MIGHAMVRVAEKIFLPKNTSGHGDPLFYLLAPNLPPERRFHPWQYSTEVSRLLPSKAGGNMLFDKHMA